MAKALMYARTSSSGGTGTGLDRPARLGATNLGYHGPRRLVTVAGTARTGNFDNTTWSISERGRGQANQLTIDLFGFTPASGDEIILAAGVLSNRLFRGTIVRIRQLRSRLDEGRVVYRCTCLDWNYQLANIKVTKKYLSQTATAIAQDLISTFAPAGFTSTYVQSDLATIDDIQFTMQSLPSALQQLGERIGVTTNYIDYDKALHFRLSVESGGPQALTSSNPHARAVDYEVDIEALRNRILVEGKGTTVRGAIAAGSTTIPVEDASMFNASGGTRAP